MMTAYGSVEKAVEAMRKGAFDYILKPFKNEELKLTVRKAIDHHLLVWGLNSIGKDCRISHRRRRRRRAQV